MNTHFGDRALNSRTEFAHNLWMTSPAVDIYQYLNYRVFLLDFYRVEKTRGRGFSYRAFARRAGFAAPNYLKLVIEGARNLTPSGSARVSAACRLVGEESSYFVTLVRFNDARATDERQQYYQQLSGFRGYRKAHRLELQHAAYHSNWYIAAIHELALRHDFRSDATWIAAQLVPAITKKQATQALDVLNALGLLSCGEDGETIRPHPIVSTGPEAQGVHIATYHCEMMRRAESAIDLFPASQRDLSSLTLCLDRQGLSELKRRLQTFRQEILAFASTQSDPKQVIQLNLQLFPLSKEEK